jgi:phosphatidylserine decarboxylase
MVALSEQEIESKYRRMFGRLAGYLPEDRSAVDEFLAALKKAIEADRAKRDVRLTPSVAALARLLEVNGIAHMYVYEMIQQTPKQYKKIESIEELLLALNRIVTSAPLYNPNPNKINNFPMSSLFTYMMMTPAGESAFRYVAFNDAIRVILKEWCDYLDSRESLYVLNTGEEGWLSPAAYQTNELYQFVIPDPNDPHWGWQSFNDYFHRQIKPEVRPVIAPDDPKIIVSANDGTIYNIAYDVKRLDRFWIKGQPYSLVNMLNDDEYVDRFVGGDVFQSFLSGADYHRWHAPVAGTVVKAGVVDGLMFSDAESAGFDPTAATYSQGYESSVNTRGLVFIESDDPSIGLVCVMPIGITEISSVRLVVQAGQRVAKGEELGYFSYGGSSMCLVFQPGAIKTFTVGVNPQQNADNGPPISVNAQIAVAN